jgi:hypothetical protein
MKCKAEKKRGGPCGAAALKGREYCRAHDPATPPAARFGTSEQATAAGKQGGRPRNPRPAEVLRERIEDRIDAILDPLFDGLTAERAVVVGTGPGARLEMVVDHPTRLSASREIMDRVEGRPTAKAAIAGQVEHKDRKGAQLDAAIEAELARLVESAEVENDQPGGDDPCP